MRHRVVSDKRQKLIDEFNKTALKVGDKIACKYNSVTSYKDEKKNDFTTNCIILKIGKKIIVKHQDGGSSDTVEYTIGLSDIAAREIRYIGSNPFEERKDTTRPISYTFDSIIFNLN